MLYFAPNLNFFMSFLISDVWTFLQNEKCIRNICDPGRDISQDLKTRDTIYIFEEEKNEKKDVCPRSWR